jgi:spore coat polysaccharide biosynthesis protein SpsF
MIVRQLERISRARLLDGIVVATSVDPSDDELASLLVDRGVRVFRGSLTDVLGRFVAASGQYPAQHIVRLTADCPLADPDVIDAVVAHHLVCAADITTNSLHPTFADGLDVEVITASALERAGSEAGLEYEREHVTQFFYRRPDQFRIVNYSGFDDFSVLRWTVDYSEDFAFVDAVYNALYPVKADFGFRDILRLLADRPELKLMNSGFLRNEGLAQSIAREESARKP